MSATVLHQLRISHFNEKVRWALDYKGVPHRRRDVLPGTHRLRARMISGGWTTPVLEIDGQRLGDSTRIIESLERRFPDPPLYPAEPGDRQRALEIEDWFDEEVADDLRRVLFDEMLHDRDLSAEVMMPTVKGPLLRFAMLLFPLTSRGVRATYKINPRTAEAGRERIREALDRIETERAGAEFLVGSALSIADLTAASVLSPLVGPAEFSYPLPEPADLPPGVRAFRESVSSHPGFTWVLETFRNHRGASAEMEETAPAATAGAR